MTIAVDVNADVRSSHDDVGGRGPAGSTPDGNGLVPGISLGRPPAPV